MLTPIIPESNLNVKVSFKAQSHQLCLPLTLEIPHFKPPKPQISSVPGISPKRRDRYQVKLGERILATNLTVDEAIKVAKGGGRNG